MAEALQDLEAKAARRRREKPQLSCNLCRKRKLRCDRSNPCHNCSRRGLAGSCNFPESTTSLPATSSTGSPSQPAAPNVKDRVKQLETQVDLLMGALRQTEGSQTTSPQRGPDAIQPRVEAAYSPSASYEEPVLVAQDTAGYMEFSPTGTTYVGGAHWMAILRNIPQLGEVLSSDFRVQSQDNDMATPLDEPDLMDWHDRITRDELLSAVPPKPFADNLVAVCFTNTNVESMLVHPPTFRKEYERFWEDSSSATTMWIGQLFVLMCLAVQYQQFSPDEARRLEIADSDPENLIRFYREKTIQCLVLGRYGQGPRYTVETYLLYLFSEALQGDHVDSLHGPWVMWGDLIRIAFRSGYHRDGSHFPELSCFEAETRRRVWSVLVGWDVYLSAQFALPRMINLAVCDTTGPRNLFDEDIYEHMVELPPERPSSARSNSQFHAIRNRLLAISIMISDLIMSKSPIIAYSEVLRLDKMLTSTYDEVIPPWQSQQPAQDPIMPEVERATVSVTFTFLSFIYHRAQILLHHKYMSVGRRHTQYMYSRKVCLEAALTIAQHQWVLYLETQVGGELCRHGWKFLTLLVNDFLYSTAILCAELAGEITLSKEASSAGATPASTSNNSSDQPEMRDRVFHALSSSYIVWLQSKDAESSRSIRTVVTALKHILGKAQEAGFGQAKMIAPVHSTVPRNQNINTGGSGITPLQPVRTQESEKFPETSGNYFSIGNFPL